jgi:Condensation domain
MKPDAPVTQLSDAKRRLLEARLKGGTPGAPRRLKPILRRDPSAPVPLSLAQEEIWRRTTDATGKPPFCNESITIHRHGPLDVHALERSFTEIVRRHESWRTTFELVDGQPLEIVHPAPESFPIARYDLSALSEAMKKEEALRWATEQAREPFNLKEGPLVRVRLIDLNEYSHRVHVTMHQIIVDGVSVFRVLPLELTALYEAFSRGKAAPLLELAVQYGDFACWQREFLEGAILEQQLRYWQEQLSGELPVPHWLNNNGRPPSAQTYLGSIMPGTWPRKLADQLHTLCQQESVTLFMVLLAGFVLLCHHDAAQNDIIIGTLAPAGRERPEVQELLGYFLNPVPLRFRLTKNMTFRDLLHHAREVVSGAVTNDDVPFHRIVERLAEEPNLSRNPYFDVLISLAPGLPDLPLGWTQTFMDVESGGSAWNFYLELNERLDGLIYRVQYNPELFNRNEINRIMQRLKSSLEIACVEPGRVLSELRLK